MFRDADKLRRILEININKPSTILPFLENLNSEILINDDPHNNLLSRATAVCNEDYPFRYLTVDSIDANIEDEYKTGVIIRKEKSLYDYIFKVYAEIKTDNIAYENIANINDEVDRILSITDEDDTLKLSLGLEIENLSSEFLSINGNLPGMVTTDRIFVYSALLNYSRSEIENTIYYKNNLIETISADKNITNFIDYNKNPLGWIDVIHNGDTYRWNGQYLVKDRFNAIPRENLTKIIYNDKEFIWKDGVFKLTRFLNIPDNWDQVRKIFIEFLENLGKGTINY